MERLVLWDVDGTLLTTDGIAAHEMQAAMRAVIGPLPALERGFYAGKTDWQIIRESFPHLGDAEVSLRMHEFVATYTRLLDARRPDLVARSHVFAGVPAALAAVGERAVQAPLTGNIANVARIKLDCTDLLRFLDTDAGAYGDDHPDRVELVSIAVARASERYGRSFSGREIVVVGDTPNDIRCGRAHGTRVVAVATGHYALNDLAHHQPDVLLPDLTDTAAVIAAIFG